MPCRKEKNVSHRLRPGRELKKKDRRNNPNDTRFKTHQTAWHRKRPGKEECECSLRNAWGARSTAFMCTEARTKAAHADMRFDHGKWRFYKFNGRTKWTEQTGNSESQQEVMKYMLNAYRVLLTRARLGMVICVPTGNANKTNSGFWEDSTRLPEYYDGTYQYLKSLGIEEL